MAVLGCIADDFTGASDAASFLVKGGMSVHFITAFRIYRRRTMKQADRRKRPRPW